MIPDFSLAGLANNGLLTCSHITQNISVETSLRVYGHHHPDYRKDAVAETTARQATHHLGKDKVDAASAPNQNTENNPMQSRKGGRGRHRAN